MIWFCYGPGLSLSQAQAAESEWILRQSSQIQNDQTEIWTNASYGLGASAMSNAIGIAVVAGAGILYQALEYPNFIEDVGPGILAVPVFSALGTAAFMHLWSPQAEAEQFSQSFLGALTGSALALVLIVPLYLLFNQGSFAETYWAILPPAFVTTLLLQGLGAAWGHEIGKNLSFSTAQPAQGLQLSYHWEF